VKGNVEFINCRSLNNLVKFNVFGNLNIIECSFKFLNQLFVGDNLFIYDCRSFQSFKKEVSVKSDLQVARCPNFRKLPDDFKVGEKLIFFECPKFTQYEPLARMGKTASGKIRQIIGDNPDLIRPRTHVSWSKGPRRQHPPGEGVQFRLEADYSVPNIAPFIQKKAHIMKSKL
jgi:hypothetical protein